MKIYKRAEIEEIMTNMVSEHMAKGYRLSLETMRGSQSDVISYVDVTDGKEIRRISIQENYSWLCQTHTIKILVERFEYTTQDVLWTGEGKELGSEVLYSISGYHQRGLDGPFVRPADWALLEEEIEEKRDARRRARAGSDMSKSVKHEVRWDFETIKRVTSNEYGWKRLKPEDIKCVVKRSGYESLGRKFAPLYIITQSNGREHTVGGNALR